MRAHREVVRIGAGSPPRPGIKRSDQRVHQTNFFTHNWAREAGRRQIGPLHHGDHSLQHLVHHSQSELAAVAHLPGHLLQRHVPPQLEQPRDELQTQELHARGSNPGQPDEHTRGQPPSTDRLLPVCDLSGGQSCAGSVPGVQHSERERRRSRQSRLGVRCGRLADLLPATAGHRRHPDVGVRPQHLPRSGWRRLQCDDQLKPPRHVGVRTPLRAQTQQRRQLQTHGEHPEAAPLHAERTPRNYPGP